MGLLHWLFGTRQHSDARQQTHTNEVAERARELSDDGVRAAMSGDTARAIALWKEALHVNPQYGVPAFNLAKLYADSGMPDEAERFLQQAQSIARRHAASEHSQISSQAASVRLRIEIAKARQSDT